MSRRQKKRAREWQKLHAKVLALFLLIFSASVFGIYHYVNATSGPVHIGEPLIVDQNIGLEAKVEEFFIANNAPEMIPIIRCESQFKHYDNEGNLLKNREGSSAVGIAQILTSKHPDPKVLNSYNRRNDMDLAVEDFDITTVEGNLAYALVLYEVRGTRDWECAKKFRFGR